MHLSLVWSVFICGSRVRLFSCCFHFICSQQKPRHHINRFINCTGEHEIYVMLVSIFQIRQVLYFAHWKNRGKCTNNRPTKNCIMINEPSVWITLTLALKRMYTWMTTKKRIAYVQMAIVWLGVFLLRYILVECVVFFASSYQFY